MAIDIINQIEADKISRKIEPHFATVVEIFSKVSGLEKSILIAELKELVKERKIMVGRTINTEYIKVL